MQCKVCGMESGKYPLCSACFEKRDAGEIIKCGVCGKWHYKDFACSETIEPSARVFAAEPVEQIGSTLLDAVEVSENTMVLPEDRRAVEVEKITGEIYLYELRRSLITKNERMYYDAIKAVLPTGYHIFPQINLASFIVRTDGARYQNELFRNVDFLITNLEYQPQIVVEINDASHNDPERKKRDAKVQKICEEAGIPVVKLWTSYGVNPEYIKKKIAETLASLPAKRVHHFAEQKEEPEVKQEEKSAVKGCYIATCVYGSYNCPEVRVLRRFRDFVLDTTWCGRILIGIYYKTSPHLVRWFGDSRVFVALCKVGLDRLVSKLKRLGIDDSEYRD